MCCGPASADTPPAETPAPEGPAARWVAAHRLVDLGTRARDPVLVFAAARLIQGLQLAETQRQPTDVNPELPPELAPNPTAKVPDPAAQAPLPGALDAAALFETARQMAPEGSALREAIALAAAEVPAAPAFLQVSAQTGAQSLTLTLAGGEPVQIGLIRLGALTYRLVAPDGTVLCEDASAARASLCTVTLPESQVLTLTTTGSADWVLATP